MDETDKPPPAVHYPGPLSAKMRFGAGANAIRTRPNLSVTMEEVDRFLDLLAKSLACL